MPDQPKYKEISGMTADEIKAELEHFRILWGWLDPNIRQYIEHTGQMVKIDKRDYKSWIGELQELKLEITEYNIAVYEKVYDLNNMKYYWEKKIIKCQAGSVFATEFIYDRVLEEEKNVEAT